MPRNDDADPPVFSAGDVLRLIARFFPDGNLPPAAREFVTTVERARRERNEAVARANAEFDEEFLRLLGPDDEPPNDDD